MYSSLDITILIQRVHKEQDKLSREHDTLISDQHITITLYHSIIYNLILPNSTYI